MEAIYNVYKWKVKLKTSFDILRDNVTLFLESQIDSTWNQLFKMNIN